MQKTMFEALRADPCRFVEVLSDPRGLYRLWRSWRRRGTRALLTELAPEPAGMPSGPTSVPQPANGRELSNGVLVVDVSLPRYDRDAGGKSSFLYLQLLSEMSYEVYFFPNDQMRREPYATALESMGVKLLIGSKYRCGRWEKWLTTQGERVEHVILHRPNVAKRYLDVLQKLGGKKLLYFAHDLRSVRERRQFELTGDLFHRSEAAYWERVERAILARANVTYFFSEHEVKMVADWVGGGRASTLPLYPEPVIMPSAVGHDQREGLLFVGGFAHQPNLDAVVWFVREVFPLVRDRLPNVQLHVVGAEPPAVVRNLMGNGIVVEGAVSAERLQLLYESVRLMVAPLRFGAGMKGKVVEAMRQGVPVVTTPIGAEGIPNSRTSLAICESAAEMAAHICSLYQDARQWEDMRKNAMQTAAQHFSRQAAYLRLLKDLAPVRE